MGFNILFTGEQNTEGTIYINQDMIFIHFNPKDTTKASLLDIREKIDLTLFEIQKQVENSTSLKSIIVKRSHYGITLINDKNIDYQVLETLFARTENNFAFLFSSAKPKESILDLIKTHFDRAALSATFASHEELLQPKKHERVFGSLSNALFQRGSPLSESENLADRKEITPTHSRLPPARNTIHQPRPIRPITLLFNDSCPSRKIYEDEQKHREESKQGLAKIENEMTNPVIKPKKAPASNEKKIYFFKGAPNLPPFLRSNAPLEMTFMEIDDLEPTSFKISPDSLISATSNNPNQSKTIQDFFKLMSSPWIPIDSIKKAKSADTLKMESDGEIKAVSCSSTK